MRLPGQPRVNAPIDFDALLQQHIVLRPFIERINSATPIPVTTAIAIQRELQAEEETLP